MKSIFVWNVPDVPDLKNKLLEGGFDTVLLKVAGGTAKFYPNQEAFPGWGENVKPELVADLKAAGLTVYGWGFVYGQKKEANIAIEQVDYLGLDGYIYDIEDQMEAISNPGPMANHLGFTFKAAHPNVPLGFCSWALYRSPRNNSQWHNEVIPKVMMLYADFAIPMIYWDGKTEENVEVWINGSYEQHRKITDKPLIAAGRAYTGDSSGLPKPELIKYFAQRAQELGYAGLSWWVMDQAVRADKTDVWQALQLSNGVEFPEEPESEEDVTDWKKYAQGRSPDKYDDLKDCAFISVGSPHWISDTINEQVAAANEANIPKVALYVMDVEVWTQVFNTPNWENWDKEADPYYSGKGNHNAYFRGMLKGKGFNALMLDIRGLKKSAPAWIRAGISYLRKWAKEDLGINIYYIIADAATYSALTKEKIGTTEVIDFLQACGSNGVIYFVDTDGDYPAETEKYVYGPAPYVDWWYYGNGKFLYAAGSLEKLYADLGFDPGSYPIEDPITDPITDPVVTDRALTAAIDAFCAAWQAARGK